MTILFNTKSLQNFVWMERSVRHKMFWKGQVAQSIEHRATKLKIVGSNPTVSKTFLFCILSLLKRCWQTDWSHTNEIKHGIHPR